MHATLQIHTHSNRKASFRANENLRNGTKFSDAKIIVVANNSSNTNYSELKLTRPKSDVDVSKKINILKSNIRVYQKKISSETDTKKIEKYKLKIADYEQQILDLQNQKSAVETRGRKKEKTFFELIMSLPGVKPDSKYVELFIKAQKNYIDKFFGKCQLVVNAVHLDQHSLHSHAILEIPKQKTFSDYILGRSRLAHANTKKSRTDALRGAFKMLTHGFQKYMAEQMKIDFEQFESGKKYKSLKKYKLENPLEAQISTKESEEVSDIEKEEKEVLEPSSAIADFLLQNKQEPVVEKEKVSSTTQDFQTALKELQDSLSSSTDLKI